MPDSVLVGTNGENIQNHDPSLLIIAAMTGQQRLDMQVEMSENSRRLFKDGLRKTFPHLSETELHALYLERLAECHNQNY